MTTEEQVEAAVKTLGSNYVYDFNGIQYPQGFTVAYKKLGWVMVGLRGVVQVYAHIAINPVLSALQLPVQYVDTHADQENLQYRRYWYTAFDQKLETTSPWIALHRLLVP